MSLKMDTMPSCLKRWMIGFQRLGHFKIQGTLAEPQIGNNGWRCKRDPVKPDGSINKSNNAKPEPLQFKTWWSIGAMNITEEFLIGIASISIALIGFSEDWNSSLLLERRQINALWNASANNPDRTQHDFTFGGVRAKHSRSFDSKSVSAVVGSKCTAIIFPFALSLTLQHCFERAHLPSLVFYSGEDSA